MMVDEDDGAWLHILLCPAACRAGDRNRDFGSLALKKALSVRNGGAIKCAKRIREGLDIELFDIYGTDGNLWAGYFH